MKPLPPAVIEAWDERDPLCILTTVATDGMPNTIYVSVVGLFDRSTFFVANNAFHKTARNIHAGSKASLLFITKAGKAFQIKGPVELQDCGPVFEAMKKMNPKQYPGHSVAVLRAEEVFAGRDQLA
jgi:predicted pyridoxine 5'-phosphate oxidase superfamily flavin-nucleotide-binding protein